MMLRRSLVLVTLIAMLFGGSCELVAQNLVASSGRDFLLALPSLVFGSGGSQSMRINVTAPKPATVTLRFAEYGSSETVAIAGGGRWERTIHIDSMMLLENEYRSNRTIRITSTEHVTVGVVYDGSFVGEGYCALPTESLGFEYVAMSVPGTTFTDQPNTFGGVVAVAAVENDTRVQIVPSVLTMAGNSPGITYTVTLDRGEIYQVLAANPSLTDLTGTRITATRPVAVYSGHRGVATDSASAINALLEQLVPTADWGRLFYTLQLAEQSSGLYRIHAESPGTEVRVNGLRIVTLGAGEAHQFRAAGPARIETSKPVMLVQLGTHNPRHGRVGIDSDPSMAVVNPVESYAESFAWSTPTMPTRIITDSSVGWRHWAMITAPTSSTGAVRLDGQSVSFAYLHGDGAYATALVEIAPGPHSVSSPRPVNVQTFGDSHYDAYAYPAGMRLREPFRAAAVIARTCLPTLDTTITVYNFGADQIQVLSTTFIPGSSSQRISPDPPFLVPAGGARRIAVRIPLPTYGRVLDTLTIATSTSGSRPLRIPIDVARDSLAIGALERSVLFAPVSASTPTRDTTIHIVNTGTGPVIVDRASFTGPFTLVAPSLPATFAAGDTLALRVRFASQAPGQSTGRLTLTPAPCGAPVTIDLAGQRLRGAGIAVSDVMLPEVGCTSPEGVEAPVVIRSTGEEPLRFDSVQLRGPGAAAFTVTSPPAGTIVAPGDSIIATLRFAPPAPGVYTVQLRVWNSVTPGGYLLTEPIAARSVAIAPAVSSTRVDFGRLDACAGDSALAITLANRGSSTMFVSDLALTGEAFGVAPSPGFEIAPGATSTLELRFRPRGGGTFADTLRIVIAPCDTTLEVVLTGSRDDVGLNGSIDTLDMGRVVACALPARAAMTLRNDGSTPLDLRAATISAAGFSVVALGDSVLAPSGSTEIVVGYDGVAGDHAGELTVRAEPCGIALEIPLRISVARSRLELAGDLDFGALAPDVTMTRSVLLRNAGDTAITVDDLALAPIVEGLTIVSPTAPFVIEADEEIEITLEYRSSAPMSFRTSLNVVASSPCGIAVGAEARGDRSDARTLELSLPDTSAAIDSRIAIPLGVRGASRTEEMVTVEAEVRWNHSMLALVELRSVIAGGSVALIGEGIAGDEHVATLRYDGPLPEDGPLVELVMQVLLGSSDTAPLRFASSRARSSGGAEWSVTSRDGSFRTLGICYVGGGRFIRISGTAIVKGVAPTPARDHIRLIVESDARAEVSVMIVDALGRSERDLYRGSIEAGRGAIPLDISGLAAGLYGIELRSGSHVERVAILVAP